MEKLIQYHLFLYVTFTYSLDFILSIIFCHAEVSCFLLDVRDFRFNSKTICATNLCVYDYDNALK